MIDVQTVSWRNGPHFSKRHLCERTKPFTIFCGAPLPASRWATVHRDKQPVETDLCSTCVRLLKELETK